MGEIGERSGAVLGAGAGGQGPPRSAREGARVSKCAPGPRGTGARGTGATGTEARVCSQRAGGGGEPGGGAEKRRPRAPGRERASSPGPASPRTSERTAWTPPRPPPRTSERASAQPVPAPAPLACQSRPPPRRLPESRPRRAGRTDVKLPYEY